MVTNMAPPRNRKTNKDQEGTVYMDGDLSQKVQQAMFDHDLKFSELTRKALTHYIDNVLPFSQQKQSINRGNLPANRENLPVNTSPSGLYTPEQVAYLIAAMRGGK